MESDQLTLFAEDSLAKIYPPQGSKQALPATGQVYTPKCCGLLGNYNPDSLYLRMSQISLLDSAESSSRGSSMTWPRSGRMQNGIVSQLQNLARPTTEIASGLLLTPTAQSYRAWSFQNPYALIRKNHADGNIQEQLMRLFRRMITPKCAQILMMFPDKWASLKPMETP